MVGFFPADSVNISTNLAILEFKDPDLQEIKDMIAKSPQWWSATLSLQNIDIKTEQGVVFTISDDFKTSLTNQELKLKPAERAKVQSDIRTKVKGKEATTDVKVEKPKEVKCKCVHGTC